MQLTITRPAAAPLSGHIARALAAWKAARAGRADDRIIQRAVDRLSLLAPHYLDDAGLAHRAPHLPHPTPQDLLHRDSPVLPLFPRA
jgi:hypothetical protein